MTYFTSTHLDPVPLTYISCSIDFVRIFTQVTYYSVFLSGSSNPIVFQYEAITQIGILWD